ncbi:MAG: hypothetical protein V1874_02565 [Spirochaetota bacterium]
MQVSLDKLLSFNENKYVFAKAAMKAIEKINNVKEYKQEENEKIVIKVLNLVLDSKIKFYRINQKENE